MGRLLPRRAVRAFADRRRALRQQRGARAAFGSVNSLADLIEHPQLRTRAMPVSGRSVQMPATPWASEWDAENYRPAPTVDQHGAAVRAEFAPAGAAVEATAK